MSHENSCREGDLRAFFYLWNSTIILISIVRPFLWRLSKHERTGIIESSFLSRTDHLLLLTIVSYLKNYTCVAPALRSFNLWWPNGGQQWEVAFLEALLRNVLSIWPHESWSCWSKIYSNSLWLIIILAKDFRIFERFLLSRGRTSSNARNNTYADCPFAIFILFFADIIMKSLKLLKIGGKNTRTAENENAGITKNVASREQEFFEEIFLPSWVTKKYKKVTLQK